MSDRENAAYWDYWDEQEAKRTPAPAIGNGQVHHLGTSNGYASRALESELDKVAQASEGTRNDTLNTAAFNLIQLVAVGLLDEHNVEEALTTVALQTGLTPTETRATIASGFRAGRSHPRQVPPPLPDLPNVTILEDGEPGTDMAPTWAPQDLTEHVNGTYTPEQPALMPRVDGKYLLYPKRVHSFHGESESGKSLVAQAECARLIDLGHDVLYLDFESDGGAVVARLRELGSASENILNHFTYVHPEVDPRKFAYEHQAIAELFRNEYTLVVIDGVTDALGLFGKSTKDNDDIAEFNRILTRPFAARTGAAVILIDHVTKDPETRGRFAIGGQAKMAGLDGAAYIIEVTEALGRGKEGTITMRIGKDRPGGVRAHGGNFRKTDRTQEIARISINSSPQGIIEVIINTPLITDHSKPFRPTGIMERISLWMDEHREPISQNRLFDALGVAPGGGATNYRIALQTLVSEHYLAMEEGSRNSKIYTPLQPYREISDSHSTESNRVLTESDDSDD